MIKNYKKSLSNLIICLMVLFCTLIVFLFVNNKIVKVNAYSVEYWTELDDLNYISFNGEGTSSDPYKITNAKELALLSKNVNSGISNYKNEYFILENDIDLIQYKWEPIGLISDDSSIESQAFEGNFDGNNHTISNISYNVDKKPLVAVGLFGYVKNVSDEEISIKNVNVKSISFDSYNVRKKCKYVGGVAGYIVGTDITIANCSVTESKISGYKNIGGIVGCSYGNNSIINNSVNSNEFYLLVEDDLNVSNQVLNLGGIAGFLNGKADLDYGYIQNIDNNSVSDTIFYLSTIVITKTPIEIGNNNYNIGGLFGQIKTTTNLVINNLYSDIEIKFTNLEDKNENININLANTSLCIGGLIGVINENRPTITFNKCITQNAKFNVPVNLKQTLIGGFIGNSQENYININNSYSFSEIVKYYNTEVYGGFIGFSEKTFTINNSYTVINRLDQSRLSELKLGKEDNVGYFVGNGSGNLVVTNGYSYNYNNDNIKFNGHGNSATDPNSLGITLNNNNFRKIDSYNFNFYEDWSISNSKNNGFPYLNKRDITVNVAPATTYESGEGTKEKPFIITTKEQLVLFSNQINSGINANKYFALGNDIDLNGVNWTPIGNESKSFYGDFNGNGYSIKNLSNISNGNTTFGLFGNIYGNSIKICSVYNLNLEDVNLTIEVNKNVKEVNIAPLIAFSNIYTSISEVSVSGKIFVKIFDSQIVNIGGIVGKNYGSLSNSYSELSIDIQVENTFTSDSSKETECNIGGLVGYISGNMNNCYSKYKGNNFGSLININVYSEFTKINLGSLIGKAYIERENSVVKIEDNFTTDILLKVKKYPSSLIVETNLGAIIGKLGYGNDIANKDYSLFKIKNNHYRLLSKNLSQTELPYINESDLYIDPVGVSDFINKYNEVKTLLANMISKKQEITSLDNEIQIIQDNLASFEEQLNIETKYNQILLLKDSLEAFENKLKENDGLVSIYKLLTDENNQYYSLTNLINNEELKSLENSINLLENSISTVKTNISNETEEIKIKQYYIDYYNLLGEYCLNIYDYIYMYTNAVTQNLENPNFEQIILAIIVVYSNSVQLKDVDDLRIDYLNQKKFVDNEIVELILKLGTLSEENKNTIEEYKTSLNNKKEEKLILENELEILNSQYLDYISNYYIENRTIGDIKCIPSLKVSDISLKTYLTSISYDFNSVWTFISNINDNYPILRKNVNKNNYTVTQNNIKAGNVDITGIVVDDDLNNTKNLSTSSDNLKISFNNLSNDPYIIKANSPNKGYVFVKWEIKNITNGNITHVYSVEITNSNFIGTIGNSYELTAIYDEIEYTITLNGNGYGKFEVVEDFKTVKKEVVNVIGTVSGLKEIPKISTNLKDNNYYKLIFENIVGEEVNKETSFTCNTLILLNYVPINYWSSNIKEIEPNSEGIFEIGTAEELSYIANCFNTPENRTKVEGKKFILTNNIDLSGKYWTPIKDFYGNFNGNGYKIEGINFYSNYGISFIQNTKSGSESTISNLQVFFDQTLLLNKHTYFASLVYKMQGIVTIEGCVINTNLTAIKCEDSFDVSDDVLFGSIIGISNSTNNTIKNNLVNLNVLNSDNSVNLIIGGVIGSISTYINLENNIVSLQSNEVVGSKTVIGGIIGLDNTNFVAKNNYFITTNSATTGIAKSVSGTINNSGAVKFDFSKKQEILSLVNTSNFSANYDKNYTLYFNGYKSDFTIPTSSILGSASIGLTSSGINEYCYGDTIKVSIIVNKGYKFICWKQDDILSTDSEFSFVLTPDLETGIIAEMDYESYKLTVNLTSDKENETPGKVKINNGELKTNLEEAVKFNSPVTLTVEEGKGFKFIGWFDSKGNKIYDEKTITFTMQNDDLVLIAKFENSNKILLPLLLLIGSIVIIVVLAILLVKKKRRYQHNKTN